MKIQCLLVGIAVLGCSTSEIASQASVPRLFWGTAQFDAFGTQAVVLCLDEPAKAGKLFVPPLMAKLEGFERVGEGIRFKTETVDDRIRSFDVRVQGGELRGSGEQVDLQGYEPTRTFALSARQVTPAPDGTGQTSLAFSNAGTSPQTGDFTGGSLEIVSTNDGDRGVLVFFDSPWFEKVGFPYYLFDIARSEKTIRFQTQTPKGRVKYRVDLDGSIATLSRDGQSLAAYYPMPATKPVTRCSAGG